MASVVCPAQRLFLYYFDVRHADRRCVFAPFVGVCVVLFISSLLRVCPLFHCIVFVITHNLPTSRSNALRCMSPLLLPAYPQFRSHAAFLCSLCFLPCLLPSFAVNFSLLLQIPKLHIHSSNPIHLKHK